MFIDTQVQTEVYNPPYCHYPNAIVEPPPLGISLTAERNVSANSLAGITSRTWR